jgi:multiple sugar transport system ATP-binding protein
VLHGVDIDIADGLSPCCRSVGCGKSTLLRMIAGLEEISAGEIRIGNRRVNDVPPKERDIAMVFQNYALYPHDRAPEPRLLLMLAKKDKATIEQKVGRAAEIPALGAARPLSAPALGRPAPARRDGRAIVRDPQVFCLTSRFQPRREAARGDAQRDKELHQRLRTPRFTSRTTRSRR